MLRRLHPLESAPRLEGRLVRDVIGGRSPWLHFRLLPIQRQGRSAPLPPLSPTLAPRLWHPPNLFPSDILSGIRGVAELRSSNTAILAGNSYASFISLILPSREVFPP